MFTTETETKAHVKTDHSQTIFNCNKCHETFNSQAFQEEHTETYLQSVIRLNHIVNDLAPACTMCCKRIANKKI